MKTIVVYDRTGKVFGTIQCGDEVKTARCMITDLPDGAVVEEISLENPKKPQILSWYDPVGEDKREREMLVKDIIDKVHSGASLRDLILDMDMSNTEKWKLEEEVMKYGI